MKVLKFCLFSLLSVFLMPGCSSTHDDAETLPNGHYVARSGSLVLSLELDNGKCWHVTAFENNGVFSQVVMIQTTGQYPNYTYSGDNYSMVCSFANTSAFTATMTGKLPNNVLGGDGYTEVSGSYQFNKYDGVLDANGDGIIDDPAGK